MRRAVVLGSSLGLLVVVLAALYIGLRSNGYFFQSAADEANATVAAASITASTHFANDHVAALKPPSHDSDLQGTANSWGSAESGQSMSAAQQSLDSKQAANSLQERRLRLGILRSQLSTLLSQGSAASPEKMRELVNELQAISATNMDPRYLQSIRNIMDLNVQVQQLSHVWSSLAENENLTRRQEILTEMKALGERIVQQATQMRLYAPSAVAEAPSKVSQ